MEKALVIISNYYIDNQGTFSYFVTLQPQTLIYFIWILCENQNKEAYSSEAERKLYMIQTIFTIKKLKSAACTFFSECNKLLSEVARWLVITPACEQIASLTAKWNTMEWHIFPNYKLKCFVQLATRLFSSILKVRFYKKKVSYLLKLPLCRDSFSLGWKSWSPPL